MFEKQKVVICIFGFFAILFAFPITSNAAGTSPDLNFSVGYSQPTCNDNSGYLSVAANYGSEYRLQTYFWTISREFSEVENSSCEMEITVNSNNVKFHPIVIGTGDSILTLGYFDYDGHLHMLYYGKIGLNTYNYTQSWSVPISGYIFGGNATGFGGTLQNFAYPTVYWNNQPNSITLSQQLSSLTDLVGFNNNISQSQLQQLENIYNKASEIRQTVFEINFWCSNIYRQAEHTNSWLGKIHDLIENAPAKEKQEATTQGDSSISEGKSSIEDKGTSFGESLGGLVDSLSYTGTDCSWTFPQVNLPAIPGVMDEVRLISEQPINFTDWVEKIPSDLLLLIRSISTCALIVYCFKELYSTISYVLTLRGGGADE